MSWQATTTVEVRRPADAAPDDMGDVADGWTGGPPQCVPAHIAERSHQVYDQASGRTKAIRYYRLLTPAGTELAEGDRVEDQADQAAYLVRHVYKVARTSPVRDEVVRADLERVA